LIEIQIKIQAYSLVEMKDQQDDFTITNLCTGEVIKFGLGDLSFHKKYLAVQGKYAFEIDVAGISFTFQTLHIARS
jgi:hypothetical protein